MNRRIESLLATERVYERAVAERKAAVAKETRALEMFREADAALTSADRAELERRFPLPSAR